MGKEKTLKQLSNPLSKKYRFVTIEPFYNPDIVDGGWEKLGASGVPEAPLSLPIASSRETGERRVLTGIDQKAIKVLQIEDDEKRNAVIKQMAEVTSYLKNKFGISEDTLDATNFNFWNEQFRLTLKRGEGKQFDIENNYVDILTVMAIKAGGYPEIAPSYNEAMRRSKLSQKVTHYLYEKEEVDETKAAPAVEKALLIGKLANVYEEDPTDMMYVAILIMPISNQYTRRTTPKLFLSQVVNYIDGNLTDVKVNLRQRINDVKKVLSMENDERMIRSVIKLADYMRWIKKDKDGDYVDVQSGETGLGRNHEELYEFFKNPLHAALFQHLRDQAEDFWSTK